MGDEGALSDCRDMLLETDRHTPGVLSVPEPPPFAIGQPGSTPDPDWPQGQPHHAVLQNIDLVILWGKVGVNHGRVHASVAEPLRDFEDADAFHHQVRGERVAEGVEGKMGYAAGVDDERSEFCG